LKKAIKEHLLETLFQKAAQEASESKILKACSSLQATTLCQLAHIKLIGDIVQPDFVKACELFAEANRIGRIDPKIRALFVLERLHCRMKCDPTQIKYETDYQKIVK